MSTTDGGGGKVYLGFNAAAAKKTGSFGLGVAVDGGETKSQLELMDINGDGLPDKVYREGKRHPVPAQHRQAHRPAGQGGHLQLG